MKKVLIIAGIVIFTNVPFFSTAQEKSPADLNNKQEKDQVPPLKELYILKYKTDFSTLADQYKDDLFPKSNTSTAIHFYRGISLYRQGGYLESIGDFKTARLDTSINKPVCNFFLALCYMQLNWHDSILGICSSTLGVPAPELMKQDYWNNTEFTREKVFISYILGTYQLFQKPLDSILIDALFGFCTREQKFLEAFYNYGTYCFNLGRYKKAIEMLLRVHDLKSAGDSIILLDLGYLYRLAGDNVQAMKSYDLLLSQQHSYMGYNNRGCLYAYMKNYSKAKSDLSAAVRKNNQGFEALFNRGLAYLKMLDYERAAENFTSAIHIRTGFSDAYYYRGFALKAMGDYPNSVRDFTRALELRK